MANHASAEKRYRQSERRRLHNRYYAKTTRNAIRALRNTTDKGEAAANAPKVYAMIDKLAKIGVITSRAELQSISTNFLKESQPF